MGAEVRSFWHQFLFEFENRLLNIARHRAEEIRVPALPPALPFVKEQQHMNSERSLNFDMPGSVLASIFPASFRRPVGPPGYQIQLHQYNLLCSQTPKQCILARRESAHLTMLYQKTE